MDGHTARADRSFGAPYIACVQYVPGGQIQTHQPCLATANAELQTTILGAPPHVTVQHVMGSTMERHTQDWSQPNWSSGAGNWASDSWPDSIWSCVCDKREGPGSVEQ